METSKILSADFLDLLFDDRNKAYGAYELRRTYHKRIVKSLLITCCMAGLVFAGSALAGSKKTERDNSLRFAVVEIKDLEEEKIPEELPEPEPQPEEQQPVKTEPYTTLQIMDDNQVENPPPTQEDLTNAKIDLFKSEGENFTGVVEPEIPGDGNRVIEAKKPQDDDDGIFTKVEVEAKFDGDWAKFLIRNLRADIPVNSGAPAGRHTVIIQFVVDVDGSISDIKPLTNVGFGMEEEAIRVIKKSKKWEPAFQNSQHVKAYRKQYITFEVMGDE